MRGIVLKNGCIFYYGNPAGYVEKDSAVVDPIFQGDELNRWLNQRKLTAKWTEGVFERMASGKQMIMQGENIVPLKKCRIWQLKAEVDPLMKFIGYEQMARDFGEPYSENYEVTYDGEVETNELEAIYCKFNLNHPIGFIGHCLSMSDIVEIYDENGSEFHYVDHFGFQKINFNMQNQDQGMSMNI